jgi:nucleoside-diphosphate-sugar epimerase
VARALITGGSGYLGSRLRDRLLADGEAVRVFDLLDAGDRLPAAEFVQGDIRDPHAVRRACEGVDVVYHCVAQVPVAKDARRFESVNVGGTRVLLEAMRAVGVRRLVYASSSAVFGVPAKNPVDETMAPRPAEAYGRAKLAGERLIASAAEAGTVEATILRPRTILGPGRLGIFHILFDWVAEGRNIPVLGAGDNVYQFVHSADVADLCVRAARRSEFGVYHCGAASYGTMRDTLEALCSHAGTGSRVVSLPAGVARAAMRVSSTLRLSPLAHYHWLMYGESLYFDIGRAERELGWKPRWSNVEMICQSYDWYRTHERGVRAGPTGSPHRSPLRQGVLALLKRAL